MACNRGAASSSSRPRSGEVFAAYYERPWVPNKSWIGDQLSRQLFYAGRGCRAPIAASELDRRPQERAVLVISLKPGCTISPLGRQHCAFGGCSVALRPPCGKLVQHVEDGIRFAILAGRILLYSSVEQNDHQWLLPRLLVTPMSFFAHYRIAPLSRVRRQDILPRPLSLCRFSNF